MAPEGRRLSDVALAASSVVVMGLLSLVTTVCRVLTGDISRPVLYCWGATCWIVCFGAPLGSLLLTPGLRAQLRMAFYVLALAQFVCFAVIKIRGSVVAWIAVGAIVAATLGLLKVHSVLTKRSLIAQGTPIEKFSASSLKVRLVGKEVSARGNRKLGEA